MCTCTNVQIATFTENKNNWHGHKSLLFPFHLIIFWTNVVMVFVICAKIIIISINLINILIISRENKHKHVQIFLKEGFLYNQKGV